MSDLTILRQGEEDGYVYLAKADTGHFKVGRSVDPEKRIKHFDTQMPVDVREWHFFRADDYVEAEEALHEICEEHAEHVKGEWWKMPEYLVWWIKEISYYTEGHFYGGDWRSDGPMEDPSESYANYSRHFGERSERISLPSKDAFPSYHC